MSKGHADAAFLRKGGTKGGRGGERGRGPKRKRGRGGERERVQPRSTHLVRVEEEKSEENSILKDLSPISVETTDKGGDIYMTTVHTEN